MTREEVKELHYITPIANVPSILEHGILSHNGVKSLPHDSIAMAEVQELRANKKIPGAGRLHDYVNLYFDAHNAMLCKRQGENDRICVLRVSHEVIDISQVIVSTGNAASRWVGFYPVMQGLPLLDRRRLFARYWTHPNDPHEEDRHRSEKCAEVLVPRQVIPDYILGAYVANQTARVAWDELDTGLAARHKNGFFF